MPWRRATTAALLVALTSAAARADDLVGADRVPAAVIYAYDGDTITVDAHVWPDVVIRTHVRLRGIDTPEIDGKCERERRQARAARDAVRALVDGRDVLLEHVTADKYGGRVDATVILQDGRNLADMLIAAGLGRPYDGGARGSWC